MEEFNSYHPLRLIHRDREETHSHTNTQSLKQIYVDKHSHAYIKNLYLRHVSLCGNRDNTQVNNSLGNTHINYYRIWPKMCTCTVSDKISLLQWRWHINNSFEAFCVHQQSQGPLWPGMKGKKEKSGLSFDVWCWTGVTLLTHQCFGRFLLC